MKDLRNLLEGEALFEIILNAIQIPVFITDSNVKVLYSNVRAQTLVSWTPQLKIKNGCGDLLHCVHAVKDKSECGNTASCPNCTIRQAVNTSYFEKKLIKAKSRMTVINNKQEQSLMLLATAAPIQYCGKNYVLLILEDISDIYWSTRPDLNNMLMEKVPDPSEQMFEQQQNVAITITKKIQPTIGNLKNTKLDEQQKLYLNYLETATKEIASPFYKTLSGEYFGLTPMEAQVADLIRIGKVTKEIAVFLNTSVRAIEVHRYNIRKKSGISKKKVNLRKFLTKVGSG